jgi:DNA-binding CsgD family transcriptional regulator
MNSQGLFQDEMVIHGTPVQFGNMVKSFAAKHYQKGELDPYLVMDTQRSTYYAPNADPIIIFLGRDRFKDKGEVFPFGRVIAQSQPGQVATTLLEIAIMTVYAKGEAAKYWWDLLRDEIDRRGLRVERRMHVELPNNDQGEISSSNELTDREKEVAALLAEGLSNKMIAKHLVINVDTVKKHKQNIKSKWGMDTTDREEMRKKAVELGYKKSPSSSPVYPPVGE